MVPAPMLQFAPVVVSPRYAKWFDFVPGAQARLLGFDEVADLDVRAELGARAQPRKRSQLTPGADDRAIDDGMRMDHRPVADTRVFHHAARTDTHTLAEHDGAFEHDVDVDQAIGAG